MYSQVEGSFGRCGRPEGRENDLQMKREWGGEGRDTDNYNYVSGSRVCPGIQVGLWEFLDRGGVHSVREEEGIWKFENFDISPRRLNVVSTWSDRK